MDEEEAKTEQKVKAEVDEKEEEAPGLEQEREALGKEMQAESSPPEEKEDEGKPEKKEPEKKEGEVEDIDWDGLMAEFPQLEKIGIKSVRDLAARYAGGVEQFEKDHQIVTELEKRGIKDPRAREELLKKLEAGAEITPSKPAEKPKSFVDFRKENLTQLIPKQVPTGEEDEITGEPVMRETTEEERTGKLSELSNLSELIYPSAQAERLNIAESASMKTFNDLEWQNFQIVSLLKEKFKDEIVPDELRGKIEEFMKPYPAIGNEIVNKAINEGRNFWGDLHKYYLSQVKKDDIDKAKEERLRIQAEKDAQDKLAARTESGKPKTTPSETEDDLSNPEGFEKAPLDKQQKWLKKQMGGR